ncbi:MAG TPA: sigma-70 family RNA polymerase sigma factor, partial [Candidatus Saccharimonadales bacterium]|nr:sigma-70 family RNA polymerase sigma factor [Candidatus Saccharimonadales bacterium]
RQWVEQKCAQWDISAPAVDRFLRTARVADPELVKMARERKSGHKLEAITPKHLSAIAQLLPNNYELQRLVADTAVTNTLTIPEARALALAISKESDRDKVSALVESKVWERMSVGSKSLTKARHPEIDLSKPESYLQILQDKFFDDQVSIAQLLIENAILTGVYTPREEAGPRLNTLVVEADLPDAIQELPEDQREPWEADKVAEVAEKVVALNGLMSSFIYRRYGMSLEDREDIISTATIRFLTRVSDGRLSKEYAENGHLQRLLLQFVSYATIDHIRALRGRNGDKPIMVSLDAEDDEGFSLKDRLSIPESEEPFDINAQNGEFIKSMLPHLNERERRVLMLKGYFGLTYAEIGLVIGTTEATIAQAFNTCKKKALKLSDKAALAFLS